MCSCQAFSSPNLGCCLKSSWIGGHATLVSIGDIFDRGIDDLETTEALLRLKKVAQTQNGTVLLMLGNHEVLNARWGSQWYNRRRFFFCHGRLDRTMCVCMCTALNCFIHCVLTALCVR